MYQKCPKCGHQRAPGDATAADVCPACGLIFSKYLKARVAPPVAPVPAGSEVPADGEPALPERVRALFFYVPEEVESTYVYLRGVLLAALIVYGIKLAAMDIPSW